MDSRGSRIAWQGEEDPERPDEEEEEHTTHRSVSPVDQPWIEGSGREKTVRKSIQSQP